MCVFSYRCWKLCPSTYTSLTSAFRRRMSHFSHSTLRLSHTDVSFTLFSSLTVLPFLCCSLGHHFLYLCFASSARIRFAFFRKKIKKSNMHSECTIVRIISVDWLHTAKLGFRNGLEASVGKSFVRHLRAVFYELTPDRIARLKLRGCVALDLFAPLLKSEYNNPAKHGHQRLPLSKVNIYSR